MRIALACDHGGFRLKHLIMEHLESTGHKISDLGSYTPDSVDYPDYAVVAAESVANGENDRAILVCTTGIGMCIAANKVHGIRAALCFNEEVARASRTHNNANVLCLAGDYLGNKTALRIVGVWLKETFRRGRHKRRMDKIVRYESLNRRFDKPRAKSPTSSPRSKKARRSSSAPCTD
jgi:ribose 5-phosphate isomerase B